MKVFISFGSNIDALKNIRSAIAIIEAEEGEFELSPMYKTSAVGFEGDDFINCVASIDTTKTANQVFLWFRQIESDHGRDRSQPKFSSRPLDIDMLTYGQWVGKTADYELPRDEIEKYAFVLKPLADIAPEDKHPVSGKSYAELWRAFDDSSQKLSKIDDV